MSTKRKIIIYIVGFLAFIAALLAMWNYYPAQKDDVDIEVVVSNIGDREPRLYYTNGNSCDTTAFSEKTRGKLVEREDDTFTYNIPYDTHFIRFHFETEGDFNIQEVSISAEDVETKLTMDMDDVALVAGYQSVSSCFADEYGNVQLVTNGEDPYLVWDISTYNVSTLLNNHSRKIYNNIHVVGTVVIVLLFFALFISRNKILEKINEFYDDRKKVMNLAMTDFRSKYSGSYFGIFWAFVQPVVTIAIYTFVFQVGFKAGSTSTGYPFLLYLVSGIVPWFFFAEAWMSATNCLVEYNYLVKKVVFKIDILPIVKIISAMFVHVFFIILTFVLFCAGGRVPDVHLIQVIYYLICTFALVLAISYLSSAITPFFKDISQIIGILTQLGMWTIPIMYDEGIMSERIMRVLRLNPMYYVVTGYRDAFMHGDWFWNKMSLTIYFWVVVAIIYIIGYSTFKKLKVHFADVL